MGLPGTDVFAASLEAAALVSVPDLFVAEVGNALRKYCKNNLRPFSRCELVLEQALSLPDRIEASVILHMDAFALACRYQHPVYDALYLVLARRNSAVLLTMDRRLATLAEKLEIEVVTPPP